MSDPNPNVNLVSPDRPHCRRCGVELLAEDNWAPSNVGNNVHVCKNCQNIEAKSRYRRKARKRVLLTEERIINLKQRLRDEDRIARLVEWIKEANVVRYQDLFIQKNKREAELNARDVIEAERHAIEEAKKWTYETISEADRDPDYIIMAEVLTKHQIKEPSEGDMGVTWHIAFNECGYEGYELDGDSLPLARPGISRLARINYCRKKADKELGGGSRVGIITHRVKEVPRRTRVERRICLCRNEGLFNKVVEEAKLRHAGENASLGKLKVAMSRADGDQTDLIETFASLYRRG